jgi:hypothetical protein
MDWAQAVQDLTLHVDALFDAVESDKKFFASVSHYVKALKRVLGHPNGQISRSSLMTPAQKIEDFWDSYRSGRSAPGVLYFPPVQTSNTERTADEIYSLVMKLNTLSDEQFSACFQTYSAPGKGILGDKESQARDSGQRLIFLGHGRSRLWARVKLYIENELHLTTLEFESESRVGRSVVPVLREMLDKATFAILILTGEDETATGAHRARQNVIHEAGLFQGRLGFEKAILLKQNGVEDLSNLAGLQHIPFDGENVEQTFYDLQRVLRREGVLAN